MTKSKRFEVLAQRPVNQDGFIDEWPEVGLVAMNGPNDPKPSIKIENGKIVELDSKKIEDFDFIDTFIANHAINIDFAEEAMKIDSVKLANMLCDPNCQRQEVIKYTTAITPAKAAEVVSCMNVVEVMMALQKMRARCTPSNQCHVTSVRDNPVQLVADSAEAAARGFDEQETTMGIARYAPFNAMSLLIGSQTGRPGVITQCAMEEATELDLGMRSFTSYAETISVYGTEDVFTDGDDTPYSKAFLASCYASRGLKMRFTSGTGSEVMMGYAEGKSMLYLEARCIFIARGAGVQGLQNGSISCIGVPGGVPAGIKAVQAENLITMMLDLEVASGSDQTFSHSDIRRTARTLLLMLPGTDFIFSGYSAVPNYDNMFAGSNFDAEDFDDYNVLQRDMKVDGGLRPVTEDEITAVRNKAARALQGVYRELGLPPITDEEVTAATYAHGSLDMPERNVVEDLKAIDSMMRSGVTGVDIIRALYRAGFEDIATNVLGLIKARLAGDYLHTSAIFDKDFFAVSAVNDVNNYAGPGTGYRMSEERWEEVKHLPNEMRADEV